MNYSTLYNIKVGCKILIYFLLQPDNLDLDLVILDPYSGYSYNRIKYKLKTAIIKSYHRSTV